MPKTTGWHPPIGRWSLYPPSSFKLALTMWLALTKGTVEHLMHTEKSTCALRIHLMWLLKPQNHHEIQVQASLLHDEQPQGEKPKHPADSEHQPPALGGKLCYLIQQPADPRPRRELSLCLGSVGRSSPENLPLELTQRIMSKINNYVNPLCLGVVYYTAKGSWYKFQEKALFPPNKLPPVI